MKDLVVFPSWQVLRKGDGRMLCLKDTCPENIKQTWITLAKDVCWQKRAKKHEDGELKEGVWFEPMSALLKGKQICSWTARHAASARSWVISGAWTPKMLHDMNGDDSKKCKCCQNGCTEKHRLYHC